MSKALWGAVLMATLALGAFLPSGGLAATDPHLVSAQIDAALQNVVARVRPDQVGYATIFDGNKYVQCGHPASGGLRCEAAGSRLQPSLEHVLTPERLARVAALGWRIDPAFGNFTQTFRDKTPTSVVSETLLKTLVDGYGAQLGDVEIETQWIADLPCPPRHGFSQNLAGMIDDAPSMAQVTLHACAFMPADDAEAPLDSVDKLVARYGRQAATEIQRLRLNAKRRVFAVFQAGIGYIQCEPQTDPDVIYCEAQSVDSWSALASVLTPERVARLHAAGFADPGTAPNFSKSYPIGQFSDEAIAREVLTLLHDAYGYNGVPALTVKSEEDR